MPKQYQNGCSIEENPPDKKLGVIKLEVLTMTEQIKIINIDTINTTKDLMGDRLSTMIKYFLEDTQMYMEEIARGIKEKNPQIALISSHTIKSSAKQLGADRVSEVAKQIESLCRELDKDIDQGYLKLEKLYNELKNEIADATPELNKFC